MIKCKYLIFRCIPIAQLTDAITPSLNIENFLRSQADSLKQAGFQVNSNEPGFGFFSNDDLTQSQIERYAESDNIIRYLQVLQSRVSMAQGTNVLTRAQFLEWLNDQYGCPTADVNSLCTNIPIAGCATSL